MRRSQVKRTGITKAFELGRRAMTLVEMLVVILIITLLIGMLLPAIQMARETARAAQCRNNLKQISLAIAQHEQHLGHYPTGGWGWQWIGDPDRGFGRRQPGGWAYNVLPYMDLQAVRDIGLGLPEDEKKTALAELAGTQIDNVTCPSRRRPGPYPHVRARTVNADKIEMDARTDYAVNAGDYPVGVVIGPRAYDDPDFEWPDTTKATGISYLASNLKREDVRDGLGNTYLVGEKYLNVNEYTSGEKGGDDFSIYQGFDHDIYRFTGTLYEGAQIALPPIHDLVSPDPEALTTDSFGSAHPSIFNMAFCDGSVRAVRLAIDPEVHRRLGNRKDQLVVDPNEL